LDIVGPMLTVKELMLTFGIVFDPLGADDEDDDPQPAAIRATTAARPTQPTRRERRNVPPPGERERRPPSLLLSIPYNLFHPEQLLAMTLESAV
jgi:hypothetical protein